MKEEMIELKEVWEPPVRQTNYLIMILKNSRRTNYLFESSEYLPMFSIIYLIRSRFLRHASTVEDLDSSGR